MPLNGVTQRRHHDTQRLRHDDPAHHLAGLHAERRRGLELTLWDGIQSGADDLGDVRALVDHQPDDRGLHRRFDRKADQRNVVELVDADCG
jgi:hypothetical protein